MQKIRLTLDSYELPEFAQLASQYGAQQFGYVVTPNVDHLIRYHDDATFRELYRQASYVLCDSRFMARVLARTHQLDIKVCTGSDLTAELIKHHVSPTDSLVLIGSTETQAAALRSKFGFSNLHHFNPPMGFVKDPAALEECLKYIEAHSPFKFCLLAVGSPQQEVVAAQLKQRGIARGLALCIGASINFLTGEEKRAPLWMQKLSLEWLYRLLQNPKRLAGRYLVRGPRIFRLLKTFDFDIRSRNTN